MENYLRTVKNCNVPCCHGQHYLKFNEVGIAKFSVQELFNIEKCWDKNIKNICGSLSEKSNECLAHKRLKIFVTEIQMEML